jgi:hypothetical protein
VRARGPGGGLSDATQPEGELDAVAALDRRLTAAVGGEALRALTAAESAFAARFRRALLLSAERPLAGQELVLLGRLRHVPTVHSLLWALARLDRYADFGRGRAGAGLDVLEQLLERHALDLDAGRAQLPRHLGYFIPELRAIAKRWKHTWAPRVKAEREARGARPRRYAARRRSR